MTAPPASALQMTMIARTWGRMAPPSVPAAYTAAAVSGPKRNPCRWARGPPPSEGPAVTAGASLVLNDIPKPLVRARVLDPLHLRCVRRPVYGMGLPGELAPSADRPADLLQ